MKKLIVLTLMAPFLSFSETADVITIKNNDHLFVDGWHVLLCGQSNAQGWQNWGWKTNYTTLDKAEWANHTNAFVHYPAYLSKTNYDASSDFYYNPPLPGSPAFLWHFGPDISLAHALTEGDTIPAYVTKLAVGGKTMAQFILPGAGAYRPYYQTYASTIVSNTQSFWTNAPDVNAVVWFAHESNRTDEFYGKRLDEMFSLVRNDFGENIPIILVGLGPRYIFPDDWYGDQNWSDYYSRVASTNDALVRYVYAGDMIYQEPEYSKGAPWHSKFIHYSKDSQIILGERIADELRRVMSSYMSAHVNDADAVSPSSE